MGVGYRDPVLEAWSGADIGYLDEGGFGYIVDCRKGLIITGGFNV